MTTSPPYAINSVITVQWPAYTGCPAGHSLSGFSFLVTNGTIVSGNGPVPPNQTKLDIKLPASAGNTTVSYTALCTDFESPRSGDTVIASK